MQQSSVLNGRRFIGLLPFFLWVFFSCSSSPWQYDSIKVRTPYGRVGRLIFTQVDEIFGLSVELIKLHKYASTAPAHAGYIYVKSRTIAPFKDDLARITFRTDEKEITFLQPLLQGGQKIKLTDDALHLLVSNLLDDNDVTVFLDGFEAVLPSKGFEKKYKALNTGSIEAENFLPEKWRF